MAKPLPVAVLGLALGVMLTREPLTHLPGKHQTQSLIVADSVGKPRSSPALSVVVRLINAETDTIVTNANLSVINEQNGRPIPTSPDSLGFRFAAPPGTTLTVQASAPAYLAAQTRIINLAVSQQVLIKLVPRKPSVLTIKAFAGKIGQPLSPATATITSRSTGKSERFDLKNGRLERRFVQSDDLDIQVSSPGYTSAHRQLRIDVPPSGNRYEFDAELDKIILKLAVRAVDRQTNTALLGGYFTLTNLVGMAPIVLMPTPEIGLFTAILPSKGTYQLAGMARGYKELTRSLIVDKEQNEVRALFVANAPETDSRPILAVTTVKPTDLQMRSGPGFALSKGVVTTKTFGVIERGKSIRLNKIYFDQSSPVLRPESYTELDQLFDLLRQYPSLRIALYGHTDNQGDFDLNTQLSRDRCQAVVEYLVSKGIHKTRLKSVGRGPLDPVAPNNNEENRKKNRRVEFVVL